MIQEFISKIIEIPSLLIKHFNLKSLYIFLLLFILFFGYYYFKELFKSNKINYTKLKKAKGQYE